MKSPTPWQTTPPTRRVATGVVRRVLADRRTHKPSEHIIKAYRQEFDVIATLIDFPTPFNPFAFTSER